MRGSENYQELRQKINLFFDNELDNCDCESLLDKVHTDPKCESIFKKEKSFRDYIKSNIKRPSVSSSLLTNIKNCIKTD
jgi:hypothetical protein